MLNMATDRPDDDVCISISVDRSVDGSTSVVQGQRNADQADGGVALCALQSDGGVKSMPLTRM